MRQYRFRRWLRNWINNFDSDGPEKAPSLTVGRNEDPDHDRCLNFKVWFANGGKVVQTNRYDRIKDRHQTSMYVITEDQDFGREIDKIVTMDSLRG
jgi:hypothetical protein